MREYQSLVEVYERPIKRWAVEMSMFANANFRGKDDAAWEAGDFLGTSNYKERQTKRTIDNAKVVLINRKLAAMKPGDEEDVPDWAKGEYKGKVNG